MTVAAEERNPEFPFTLDLRRPAAPSVTRRGTSSDEMRHRPHVHGVDGAVATCSTDYQPLDGRLRRDGGGAGRAAPALRGVRAVARGARAGTSSRRAGRAPSAAFARTASPTTSTAIRRAWIGRGSSTWCRCSSRPTEWARLEAGLIQRATAAQSDPRRPLRPADAARATGCCRRRWCSRTPAFLRPCHGIRVPHGILPAPARASTWRARPTANGGCSPTARRRRRAPATRSRTASCSRAGCPRRSATARCSGWRRSSARSATR